MHMADALLLKGVRSWREHCAPAWLHAGGET
jgi:hypothetical protein